MTTDLTADRRSVGEHLTYRRLAPADLLRRLPASDTVLLYGNHAPIQVRLRPWYKVRRSQQVGTLRRPCRTLERRRQ